MATRSHSRFTDEIYCTPSPTAPTIHVKNKDLLRDEIFPAGYYQEFREGLFSAEEMQSKALYEKYPPNFKDKNKQFLLSLLDERTKYVPLSNKSILITRWKPFIPMVESKKRETKVQFIEDAFSYKSGTDSQAVEWHLNFANNDLFAYYGGHLLAQDELQVLECVELAALREYLVQTINTVGSQTVGSDSHTGKPVPTPILISNTEQVISLDTRAIYGNAFATATDEQLRRAFKKVDQPQTVNLIAIEAPSYGEGFYTRDQIRFILINCFTGFKAAQILAFKTHAMNTRAQVSSQRNPSRGGAPNFSTVIHTGWWGCGAYGNNRVMMLLTQILAAQWAQVDRIIFHTQTNEHQKHATEAQSIVDKFSSVKNFDQLVDDIFNLKLEWDKSNNT